MDTEIVKTLINNGYASLLLLLLCYAVYKKGWPWIAKQLAESKKEKQKLIADFLKALNRKDEINREMIRELSRLKGPRSK